MTFTFYLIVIILSIIFQNTVGDFLAFFFVGKPDTFLIVAIFFALSDEKYTAVISGFVLGILKDVLSGGILGINALSKTISVFAIGRIQSNYAKKDFLSILILCSIFSIIDKFIITLFFFFIMPSGSITNVFFLETISSAVQNAFLGPLLISFLFKCQTKFVQTRKEINYPKR